MYSIKSIKKAPQQEIIYYLLLIDEVSRLWKVVNILFAMKHIY